MRNQTMSEPTPEAAFTGGILWFVGVGLAGVLAWIIGLVTVWRLGTWLWRVVAG